MGQKSGVPLHFIGIWTACEKKMLSLVRDELSRGLIPGEE